MNIVVDCVEYILTRSFRAVAGFDLNNRMTNGKLQQSYQSTHMIKVTRYFEVNDDSIDLN